MHALILDCDNTMGLPGRDADDGLALLYLLGCPDVEVLGVTTTHGNAPLELVDENTRRLLRELGREDIPCYRGAPGPYDRRSEAAEFLSHTLRARKGEVAVLATGAQTNLLGAAGYDPEFWQNAAAFSLMGGLTEPLLVGGKEMGELNFSCDPQASLAVVTRGKHVAVCTGTHCLPAYLDRTETNRALAGSGPVGDYLVGKLAYWFDHNREHWNQDGFVNWDTVAAAWLTQPELFEAKQTVITPTGTSMARGMLLGGGAPHTITLPVIRDADTFRAQVFARWKAARVDPARF